MNAWMLVTRQRCVTITPRGAIVDPDVLEKREIPGRDLWIDGDDGAALQGRRFDDAIEGWRRRRCSVLKILANCGEMTAVRAPAD